MTPSSPLPYVAGVVVRSFLLERPEGNLAVYNSPGLRTASDEIRESGRLQGLYLNHAHEEMYGAPNADVPVFVHRRDAAAVSGAFPAAQVFEDRHVLGDDFEVIPTPGHTPGTTAYLWDSGQHRFLFVGDSLWVEHGEWSAVVLDEAARADYVRSLTLMRDLDFDVLVPWGAYADEAAVHLVSPLEKHRRLSEVIDRVRAGANR
jgi:glyoxylase-like metal-dependent hydrolase (beta-lactamase superfamily II)